MRTRSPSCIENRRRDSCQRIACTFRPRKQTLTPASGRRTYRHSACRICCHLATRDSSAQEAKRGGTRRALIPVQIFYKPKCIVSSIFSEISKCSQFHGLPDVAGDHRNDGPTPCCLRPWCLTVGEGCVVSATAAASTNCNLSGHVRR